jgi:ketosteroid isomerase-like protein
MTPSTTSTQDIAALEAALIAKTKTGDMLGALDEFYAEDCLYQEGNEEPRRGRAAERAHLEAFFATLEAFNGATLHGTGVGDGVTYSEWTFDMTTKDGEHLIWNEILAHRWENGLIVSERYYQA